MARRRALEQTVIPLRIKQTFFIKSRFLETVVHVGGKNKIIFFFYESVQVIIHRFRRVHIPVNVNVAAPVSPVFLQRLIRVESAGVHILKAVFFCEISKIFLKAFPAVSKSRRGGKPCSGADDHCVGGFQQMFQNSDIVFSAQLCLSSFRPSCSAFSAYFFFTFFL